MDALHDLIQQYHLEDDGEFVIIPMQKSDGGMKRCFLLKRRFMRIVFPSGNFSDFPLETVIEATIRYPELPLSEALPLLQGIETEVAYERESPAPNNAEPEQGKDTMPGEEGIPPD